MPGIKGRPSHNSIDWTGVVVNSLTVVRRDTIRRGYWICSCACGNTCSVNSMSLKSGQLSCGCAKNRRALNFLDLTGQVFGRLTVLSLYKKESKPTRWFCMCSCGNEAIIYTTNLTCGRSKGCRHCSKRKDITGEKLGMLLALYAEDGVVTGRPPMWTFMCDCGKTIDGRVAEFHIGWLRSCGCHASAWMSWSAMMTRCYDETSNRYNSYGGRGITVCEQWHDFEQFALDMGNRPLDRNLGRRHAEKGYEPSNCFWELITENTPDTDANGQPTKNGLKKGALPRNRP